MVERTEGWLHRNYSLQEQVFQTKAALVLRYHGKRIIKTWDAWLDVLVRKFELVQTQLHLIYLLN